MPSSFRMNPNAQKLMEEQARPERDRKAERVLATAKANAPVVSGAYRDGLHLESDGDETRLATGVEYGLYVEAKDNVLARALAAELE